MDSSKKKEGEVEIEKLFQEEMLKPYYRIDFLDSFTLPYEKLDVSAVIPTYNRCPYNPSGPGSSHNPLLWCIQSLLKQKPKIHEIIVVDDASQDYTKKVVGALKEYAKNVKGIEIKYIKNSERRGSSVSRNKGVKIAQSRYILFADDDCIMSPYTCFGAVSTFEKMQKRGYRIGAINLPPYDRSSVPEKVLKNGEIGHLDFAKGDYSGNLDAFPVKVLKRKRKFFPHELQILKPISILNLNGFFLCLRERFVNVGGFPDFATWPNKYGEEAELACRWTENGYDLFFQPDPKFHAVHGLFGLKTDKPFTGYDWLENVKDMISLKEAIEECNKARLDTGNRVKSEEYFYSKIISFFCIFYPRNVKGAINWAKKTYKQFVLEEDPSSDWRKKYYPPFRREEREKIWSRAINDALALMLKKEKRKAEKLRKITSKIKKRGRIAAKVMDIIDQL